MQKLSLTCFGVGDGWPCPDRNHASFLYRFGGTSVLVDCGEPVDGAYKACGLGYDLFDAILLSHMHADHVGGFFMLMQGAWLEGRRKALPIHMPGGAIEALRGMMNAAFLFDGLLPFKLKFNALKSARAFKAGNVSVTPHAGTHLEGLRARFGRKHRVDFSSYSFLFETSGTRVAHSADIGRPEDLGPMLKKPLDVLVCELAHFRPEELFRFLSGRAIGHIVFVHLAREHRTKLAAVKRTARRMLPGVKLMFPRDGEVINFRL